MWRVLLLFLVLVIAADLLLSQVEGSIHTYFEDHIPAIVSGAIILILASIRVNYFSYEDEYEMIEIRSRSLLFGPLEGPARTRYEFPKRTIYDFDYKEGLFQKKLTIHTLNSTKVKKVQKFNLTFVPLNKLKYVLKSLEDISRENRKVVDPERS